MNREFQCSCIAKVIFAVAMGGGMFSESADCEEAGDCFYGQTFVWQGDLKKGSIEIVVPLPTAEKIVKSNCKSVVFDDREIDSKLISAVSQMRNLEELSLRRTKISDGDFQNLRLPDSLQTLNLDGTSVSDAGLTHLSNLASLRSLSLMNTAITDKGIAKLPKKIEWLQLISTKVTPKGLLESPFRERIKGIYVDGSVINEEVLRALATWPRLEWVEIRNVSLKANRVETFAPLRKIERAIIDVREGEEKEIEKLRELLPEANVFPYPKSQRVY